MLKDVPGTEIDAAGPSCKHLASDSSPLKQPLLSAEHLLLKVGVACEITCKRHVALCIPTIQHLYTYLLSMMSIYVQLRFGWGAGGD